MTTAMDCVITLVAPTALDPELTAAVAAATSASRTAWHDARAADLFASGTVAELRARTADALAEAAVDAIVQPTVQRKKPLLISDMDSTLIQQECIDELASVRGLKEKVAAITERAMRGELDFAQALTERVALLRGIPVEVIDTLLSDVIVETPGATALMRACRAAGIRTVLVSGGFLHFANPVAARLGMDAAFANTLLVDNGVFSGRVMDPVLGADAKRDVLERECAALGVGTESAVALGDGANDLKMIESAGLGIGYRAKPALAAAADGNLRHNGLDAVAYALGIST